MTSPRRFARCFLPAAAVAVMTRAGGLKAGEPHRDLIQGPTFLIEHDNL